MRVSDGSDSRIDRAIGNARSTSKGTIPPSVRVIPGVIRDVTTTTTLRLTDDSGTLEPVKPVAPPICRATYIHLREPLGEAFVMAAERTELERE